MIRVVHLITTLERGGAERLLSRLVQSEHASHISHHVISMTEIGADGKRMANAGVDVESLLMPRGSPSLAALLRLVKILRRLKPDVLHCWMYHADLLGLLAGKLAGGPRVIWGIHSANERLIGYHPLTRWVVRACALLSRYPEIILSVSESGRRVHAAMGYDTSRMVVIHNGYDLDVYKPAPEARDTVRQELNLSPDTLLVGMNARFDPAKDFPNFFKAAQIVLQRYPGIHFLMAGTGVNCHNPELSRQIQMLGLTGHIHLLGWREDIAILDAALDIACLSSATEAFPNSVVEAMACGVPCVVTDAGDAGLIVGDTGRVVPRGDPGALACGLAELIDLGPEGRKILGQRARRRVAENFLLTKMVKAYESLYTNLTDKIGSQKARPVAS